jgi:hypothetical protein
MVRYSRRREVSLVRSSAESPSDSSCALHYADYAAYTETSPIGLFSLYGR